MHILFQAQIESTPFIKYACEKLFPLHTWKLIGANDSDRDQQHLRVLKVFAEMTAFCGTLDSPNQKIDAIFNVLQVFQLNLLHFFEMHYDFNEKIDFYNNF